MLHTRPLLLLAALAQVAGVHILHGLYCSHKPCALPVSMYALSRRELQQHGSAAIAAGLLGSSQVAFAADETFSRMGGALEPYIDVQKGYKLYKPFSWNQFDADPGVYDVKFQDLVEPNEIVQVSTSPVSTATSISALGDLAAVGDKFAKSRGAELLSSYERDADGSKAYTLELKGEQYHELLLLTINRGKLYRLSATATNKRWPKRSELYKNIMNSFVPKGY
mmetsp:Transcript_21709/g.35822  ORF Transcript_21709/g.35822 Transcript_21709/m.35822 type:complete len:223 (-) Transcript_21709:317-985(-)